jgi:hypothetical protein
VIASYENTYDLILSFYPIFYSFIYFIFGFIFAKILGLAITTEKSSLTTPESFENIPSVFD